jgi:hypothetical protein
VVWEKLGRVFCAAGEADWMQSHAYMPTPFQLAPDVIRVYVAFLDAKGIGRVGWVDVRTDEPTRVIEVSAAPALRPGERGSFDDNGVTPMCVVPDDDGNLRLYYTGWQLFESVRYLMLTGAAVSRDGGSSFERLRTTPVLDRTADELIARTAAYVVRDGAMWKVWYSAGSSTALINGQQTPTYSIRSAESADGLEWPAEGREILRPEPPDEFGVGRPCVTLDGDELWFSVRSLSKGYRIAVARANEAGDFERADPGIQPSEHGWDSEMLCFPQVIETRAGRYLFYNGNDYGRTGFGVAKWRDQGTREARQPASKDATSNPGSPERLPS